MKLVNYIQDQISINQIETLSKKNVIQDQNPLAYGDWQVVNGSLI